MLTAHRIGKARSVGSSLDLVEHRQAVIQVGYHSSVVRCWRRCETATMVGIPLSLLMIVPGITGTLRNGHMTWSTLMLLCCVAVLAILAVGQHYAVQHALTMTAGMDQAETPIPREQ